MSVHSLFKLISKVEPTGISVGVHLTTRAELVLVVVGVVEKEQGIMDTLVDIPLLL